MLAVEVCQLHRAGYFRARRSIYVQKGYSTARITCLPPRPASPPPSVHVVFVFVVKFIVGVRVRRKRYMSLVVCMHIKHQAHKVETHKSKTQVRR